MSVSEKKRVLVVVEDDPDMRLLIRATLQREPMLEITGEAADAATAIDLARGAQPGLVILDHSIEGDMMGLEAAPLIKEVAPQSKILLFTAYDMRDAASGEPAIDAFLPKSRISDLLATVRALLSIE